MNDPQTADGADSDPSDPEMSLAERVRADLHSKALLGEAVRRHREMWAIFEPPPRRRPRRPPPGTRPVGRPRVGVPSGPSPVLRVRVGQDVLHNLEVAAAERGITVSALVRQLLDEQFGGEAEDPDDLMDPEESAEWRLYPDQPERRRP
jgi:hypothetical protein